MSGRQEILIALRDDALREPLTGLISALRGPRDDVRYLSDPPVQAVAEALRCPRSSDTVLVSDLLVDAGGREPSDWLRELMAHAPRPFGTIALMRRPSRVAEIDATLARTPGQSDLARVLDLVVARLRYLDKPPARTPQRVEVRPISNMTELRDAYRLRHEVYTVMGYLEPRTERCRSRLEIHWTDLRSIQLGAFVGGPGSQRLAGTARIVLTPTASPPATQVEWTRRLLRQDKGLRREVSRQQQRFAQLSLPACYTVDLSAELNTAFSSDRTLGELSRLVVRDDCRGLGIARRLCQAAVRAAANAGVWHLFLECLELHEPLYAKYGFARLDRRAERVLGVNRRMITMVQDLELLRSLEAPRRAPFTPVAASL